MGTRRLTALSAAMGLTLAAALLGPLGTAPAEAAALVPITGTGSTWAQNAIDRWRSGVASGSGQTVNYTGSGSRSGLEDFAAGAVDFAVSDRTFDSPADGGYPIKAPTTAFGSLPIAAGATSLAYNLRSGGTRITDLQLSGDTVAKIFTGVITVWNNPAIQAENPQIVLPAQSITPVVRADASGSTELFTRWMATQHEAVWGDYCVRRGETASCGAASQYPVSGAMKAQSGSLGVAGYVSQSYGDGSITYVENSYALKTGLATAKLLNAGGSFVAPTAAAVGIALQGSWAGDDGVFANPDPGAYPLSSYSSMIVPNEISPNFTTEKGRSLGEFARYALCEGQALVESLGYAPLPVNLVSEGLHKIRIIPGAESVDVSDCGAPAPNAIGLAVTTIPAVDTPLSIEFPTDEPAEFGQPGLVNGVSVVTGALPEITVHDGRVSSEQGWDVAANLTPFVSTADASQVIGTRHVGLRAFVTRSTAVGSAPGVAQVAGSAVYPAQYASGSGAGETVLGGEVTLVSPVDSPAGTYTAKLTLTITSR
ncbi:phosphate ABC transporter substrate-binding protein PstS [Conyzicola sp.]|uniref:phosphate ABC transporter substrate-binding protein PstS n=1 Tax=Conyzicola sp. TaxID=1969404 RepID=UPI003989FBCD